jgi:hypothetical protein
MRPFTITRTLTGAARGGLLSAESAEQSKPPPYYRPGAGATASASPTPAHRPQESPCRPSPPRRGALLATLAGVLVAS